MLIILPSASKDDVPIQPGILHSILSIQSVQHDYEDRDTSIAPLPISRCKDTFAHSNGQDQIPPGLTADQVTLLFVSKLHLD